MAYRVQQGETVRLLVDVDRVPGARRHIDLPVAGDRGMDAVPCQDIDPDTGVEYPNLIGRSFIVKYTYLFDF